MGRVRWVARRAPTFTERDLWTELRRAPEEGSLAAQVKAALGEAARRGWVRKVREVYHSQIVEVGR